MIFKSFIVEKNISLLDNYYAVLFYGENIGLKDDFKNFVIMGRHVSVLIGFMYRKVYTLNSQKNWLLRCLN